MIPEAIVAIIIISIGAGTILGLTSMILKHRRESKQIPSSLENQSIGTSELEGLMRRAVEEAVQPLEHRLDAMQEELQEGTSGGQNLLGASQTADQDEIEDAQTESGAAVRRRSR